MSRLTGTDAKGLMEAYSNVYAPQELTEEQVWEEVENWVNSLLEEGYDLSDYTWEEMFESYIEEQGGGGSAAPRNQNVFKFPTSSAGTRRGAAAGTRSTSAPSATPAPPTPKTAAPTAAAPPTPKTAAPTAAAPSKPAAPALRTPRVTPAPAAPARPAAPASAKVAPTPAKPAGPAMGKLGGTTFERRTPTSAELKAAQAARASGASPEKALQAAKSAGAPKIAPSNTLSNTVAAASKPAAFSPTPAVAKTAPTPAAKPTPRQQRLNMEMEYDTFDTVLEHLVSEGYADTNESALVIMANMSEEWRQSILDEGDNYDKNRQRAAKRAAERNAARDAGKTGAVPGVGYVTPRRERETYRDSAGVERHTSGARMPSKDKKDN
jgi:hypothetical protein